MPTVTSATTDPATDLGPRPLRRLYLARAGFALVWAALFAATSSPFGAVAFGLAVLYPAFDLAAAVVDARSTAPADRPIGLSVNVALSLAAAVAIAATGHDDTEALLVVWGLWAAGSGLTQLLVGLSRRALGGQWPMVFSGGLSVVVGASFVAGAREADSVTALAGYAAFGGLLFLVSALRLGRR